MVVVKGDRLLADHRERLGACRPRRAVGRVGVHGADDLGSSLVNGPVDVVGGRVDLALAVDQRTVGADQHEIADGRLAERHAVAQQPEAIGALGVAGGDVTVALLTPVQGTEQPICQRKSPFSVGSIGRPDRSTPARNRRARTADAGPQGDSVGMAFGVTLPRMRSTSAVVGAPRSASPSRWW